PDQPDIPPTNLSSFIYWSIPDTGQPFEWRLNLASNIRVVIEAHVLIPGDYNNDGNVDSEDYQVWRAGFGSTTNFAADGNGDHAVDAADYVVWRANVGAGAGGTSARSSVPEPAAWMLMAVAAILQVAARFRRRACPAKVFTAS
ncbi:MAG: PEP-CTERM sorting domain-containing protein, partial [Planctomycetes bacterium]|nr:PEP-CTERM sorting domain-containing protein [Planctomycetota bacterium]